MRGFARTPDQEADLQDQTGAWMSSQTWRRGDIADCRPSVIRCCRAEQRKMAERGLLPDYRSYAVTRGCRIFRVRRFDQKLIRKNSSPSMRLAPDSPHQQAPAQGRFLLKIWVYDFSDVLLPTPFGQVC